MNSPFRIVIIGRPNVGKSTLFNRLYGRRRALVHDMPGVTRDRLEEKADWWFHGKSIPFLLVDTGGLGGDKFANEIQRQVEVALQEADLVLFVLDSKDGLTLHDEDLYRGLQRSGALTKLPIFAVVNKVDDESHEDRLNDFFALGLDPIFTLSAEHGRGIDDLKNAIIEKLLKDHELPETSEADESLEELPEELPEELEEQKSKKYPIKDRTPRIAIVGKPNVGKSTLINTLLGEERMITSPMAGTTVNTVDSSVLLDGKPFLMVDTAGIRRKSKTEQGVEVLSVVQTRKALEQADVAILVLDGELGITDQDEKIGGLIEEVGCGVVLLMNKWDTQKDPKFTKEYAAEKIRAKMAYLKYAPILFVSALRSQGLENLGDLLEEIIHQRQLKIPTHEFTEWVRKESTIHNPMNAKFFLCHQTGRNPPTFVCHVNDPDKVHFSLRRHFVNALRERWGYMGSPIRLIFTLAKNRKSLPKKKPMPRKKLLAKKSVSKKASG